MIDLERAGPEFLKSLMEYEADGGSSLRHQRVLPADLDVDAELDWRFARPGVGVRVAMV
jgi:hypothetical protein